MSRIAKTWTGSFAALLIAAGPSALPASAPPAAQSERSMTVGFADLNLSQPAAAATLYHRIKVAADRVCGPRELSGWHFASMEYYHCVKAAVDRAVTTLDRPELNAYHQAHGAPAAEDRKIALR